MGAPMGDGVDAKSCEISKPYEQTPRERAAIDAHVSRRKARAPSPRLKVSMTAGAWRVFSASLAAPQAKGLTRTKAPLTSCSPWSKESIQRIRSRPC
jgi:hypothetical protein